MVTMRQRQKEEQQRHEDNDRITVAEDIQRHRGIAARTRGESRSCTDLTHLVRETSCRRYTVVHAHRVRS